MTGTEKKDNVKMSSSADNKKAKVVRKNSADKKTKSEFPLTLEGLHALSQEQAESKSITATVRKECNPDLEGVLNNLSADIPYSDWILAAAAIKNEGGNWEMFKKWSQTAQERYDEEVAKKTWESMGGPDHPEITLGTLRYLQDKYNPNVIPAPAEFLARPTSDKKLHEQRASFLKTLFQPNDSVEVILPAANDPSTPSRPGYRGDAEHVLQSIKSKDLLNGAWVVINPVKVTVDTKTATDDTITDYRYALVEADEGSMEEQWEAMTSLPLLPPVASVVWSGGKSLHFIIRIDAANKDEYKERVKRLYAYLAENQITVDQANKNPSRMTRLAGVKRGEDTQYQVAGAFGYPNWRSFAFSLDGDEPLKIDGRSLSSAENGKNGGRPIVDIDGIGKSILADLARKGEKIIYWNGDVWFYHKQWIKLGWSEWKPTLSKLVQQKLGLFQARFSTSTVKDVSCWLKGQCHLSLNECQKQPYLLDQHQGGEEYIIFTNGAVSLKELKEKTVEECTLLPMSSNIFGEPDVDFTFDPKAKCPMWKEMVKKMFPQKTERLMFQQCFGYIVSRSVAMNTAFIWYGIPGTAKSTASDIIRWLVGEKKCSTLPFSELRDKFSTIMLTENYLNLTEEFPTGGYSKGQENAEAMFKTATCGGALKIERKGKDPGSAHAIARFILCGNYLPKFMDKEAIWDRLVIISFEHVFRNKKSEVAKYSEVMKPELPGIFNWAVEGMKSLGDMPRFPATEKAKKLLEDLRKLCDAEGTFLKENLEDMTGSVVEVPFLWERYKEYCRVEGLPQVSQEALLANVRKLFPQCRGGHTQNMLLNRSVRIIRNVHLKGEIARMSNSDTYEAAENPAPATTPETPKNNNDKSHNTVA